ncbi:MAG TPA: hypothetical protein ENL39_06050 [Candidatus Aerophobetes bacterium]|uniref:Tetratricopeptide repeat protein n=1 Tax=Aerophobetes bacterium TaxID=2030807 RepID=A0A7V5M0R2_UNCAE|nr:hypothetical protein [Candidatus Aerophobetes bacterium]
MWELFWNITGMVGLFGFLAFAIWAFVFTTFLKRRSGWYVFGACFFLILFVTGTLLFPGEEEIAEEIANPVKIYQRGIENEKKGAFERARKDYEIVLELEPGNERAVEKLQLIERREIALTFLKVAKGLCRKKKFAFALVKLKAAEKIAPPPGTLEDSSKLQKKIEKEIEFVKKFLSSQKKGG